MEFLFLGTGAADWPKETAHLGDAAGTDRRWTSVLVNEDLLIDPNPDVPEALRTFGADPGKIKYVLVSHSHYDHFCNETLLYLASDHVIHVYGGDGYPEKIPNHPNVILPSEISEITSTKNSCSLSSTLAASISAVSPTITATFVCATISPLSYSALTLCIVTPVSVSSA